MSEAASHGAKGGQFDTRFRSNWSRSQWLRQTYRRDMTDEEKAAVLAEYHRSAPAGIDLSGIEEQTHRKQGSQTFAERKAERVKVAELLEEHNTEDR